jgi:hypothetical protein
MPISISYVALFCRDPIGLSGFYSELFGFPEVTSDRSPIYRSLDADTTRLGFHAADAYALLNLDDRVPTGRGVTCYFTVEVGDDDQVQVLTSRAVELGARLVKEPYDTYYGSRQSVLADPEDNIFRINNTRRA